MRKALFSQRAIALTLLALLLFTGCVRAALWQYHRGVDRHATNVLINENITLPALSTTELRTAMNNPAALSELQWRSVSLQGHFDSTHEILLRNRYVDGAYGFGVLTLFILDPNIYGEDKKIWVDRGWVVAGKDAATPPVVSPVPLSEVEISGRLRTFDRTSQIKGSFFALPGSSSAQSELKTELKKWDTRQSVTTENFSLDLLTGNNPSLTPTHPNELPELSDGPHMAYALQWLVFGFLVFLGRILIFREDLRLA